RRSGGRTGRDARKSDSRGRRRGGRGVSRPPLGRDDGLVLGSSVRQDDRGRRPRDGDQEPQRDRPDPVTWVPPEPLLPGRGQSTEGAGRAPQPVAAFEAVLLIRAVRRTAAGTEWCLRRG